MARNLADYPKLVEGVRDTGNLTTVIAQEQADLERERLEKIARVFIESEKSGEEDPAYLAFAKLFARPQQVMEELLRHVVAAIPFVGSGPSVFLERSQLTPESLYRSVYAEKFFSHPVVEPSPQSAWHVRFQPSVPAQELRFRRLAATWKDERGATSSITDMAMQPAYQEIIGMGQDALPFLFRELEEEPDHWFWALKAITGEDPVPPESRGRVEEMAQDWLRWGREQGYEW